MEKTEKLINSSKTENVPKKTTKKAKEFTSVEFLNMLGSIQESMNGLKKFCQACSKFEKSSMSLDVVKSYLSASPECLEIFKCLEAGRKDEKQINLVFQSFNNILMRTAGDLSSDFRFVGMNICKRILQNHIREINFILVDKKYASGVITGMKMLTAMVMQGSECASDIAMDFDLSGRAIKTLSQFKPRDGNKQSALVRLSVLQFALSFFMTGNSRTIVNILELRGFLDSMLCGLPNDCASTINLFLSTLLEKVIENVNIPKSSKLRLLSSNEVLSSIAALFDWDGVVDLIDEDKASAKMIISNLAYKVLHQCCCSSQYGIISSDHASSTGHEKNILLNFLTGLKMEGSNSHTCKLVVDIFQKSPDLLDPYFAKTQLTFEPRPTKQWFDNCQLVQDIYNQQPSIPAALTDASNCAKSSFAAVGLFKMATMITPGIICGVFDRSTLMSALKHDNCDIQLRGLSIIQSSLYKLNCSLDYLGQESYWLNSLFSTENRLEIMWILRDKIKKHLPAVFDIISVWQSTCKKSVGDSEVKSQLLKVLSLYKQVFPDVFDECSHDFSTLLHGMNNITTSNCMDAICALDILSQFVYKYKWFKKDKNKKTPFYQLIFFIIQCMDNVSLNGDILINKAMSLICEVAKVNAIMGNDAESELCTWIQHVSSTTEDLESQTDKKEAQIFLLHFLEETSSSVAKRPHRYSDRLESMFVMHKSNESSSFSGTKSNFTTDWKKMIPDVVINRHQSTETTSLKHNCNDITQDMDNGISLLLLAAFENLDELQVSDKHMNLLDRYLFHVMSDLLYHDTFISKINNSLEFVMMDLISKMPRISSFPHLLRMFEELIIWNKVSHMPCDSAYITQKYVVRNMQVKCSGSKKDLQFSFTIKGGEVVPTLKNESCVAEKSFATTQIVKEFCSNLYSSKIYHNHKFKIHYFESSIARMVFYLTKISNLLNVVSSNIDDYEDDTESTLISSCLRLSCILHKYVKNIRCQNDTNDVGDTMHGTCDNGNSSCSLDDAEFTKVAQKLLSSKIIQDIFLAYDGLHHLDLVNQLSNNVADIICACFTPPHPPAAMDISFYTEQLCYSMCDHVFTLVTQYTSRYKKKIFKCFKKLYIHLQGDQLSKILDAAVAQVHQNTNHVVSISAIYRCLKQILHTDGNSRRIHTLCPSNITLIFHVMSNQTLEDCELLLDVMLQLLKRIPSFALLVEDGFVNWCFKHCESNIVIDVLQILTAQNFKLHSNLLEFFDSTSSTFIGNQPNHIKYKLLPIAVILLKQSSMLDEEVSKKRLKNIKKIYGNMLISDLINNPESINSREVDLLSSMLESKTFSGTQLDILHEQLPIILESGVKFNERWEVTEVYLKKLQNKNSQNKLTTIRIQLLNTLMILSSNQMKYKEKDCESAYKTLTTTTNALCQLFGECYDFRPDDESFSTNWESYLKRALKYQFCNHKILDLLSLFVTKLYGCGTDDHVALMRTDINSIYKMVKSHSSFLKVLLDNKMESHALKTSLVKFLFELTRRCDKHELESQDFLYLLGSYNGTLSICDQYIQQIMLIYELMDIRVEDYNPFLWGITAIETHCHFKEKMSTLYQRLSPNKVLECLSEKIMDATLNQFPLRRKLQMSESLERKEIKFEEFVDDHTHATSEDELIRYDPAFLLGVISNLLSPENLVDCSSIIKSKLLAFMLMCLSCNCENIRHLAAGCIARYYDHVEGARFSEKLLTLYLLRCIRNAVRLDGDQSISKLSSVITAYLARTSQVLFQPFQHVFTVLHRFLLVKPDFDIENVPEFYEMFFSTALEHKIERSWILDLLYLGLSDKSSFETVERRQLFRILLSYYGSSINDYKARKKILNIIERACTIHEALDNLINKQAILPWLQNIIEIEKKEMMMSNSCISTHRFDALQIVNIISSMWKTLRSSNHITALSSKCQDDLIDGKINNGDATMHEDTINMYTMNIQHNTLRQLASLCFSLISNFLTMCGITGADCSQIDHHLTNEVVQSFDDILSILQALITYVNNAMDHSSADHMRISNRESTLLKQVASLLESHGYDCKYNAIHIMITWSPTITCDTDVQLITDNLVWILENSVLCLTENCANHYTYGIIPPVIMQCQIWIQILLKYTKIYPLEDTNDLKQSLLHFYEILFARNFALNTNISHASLTFLHNAVQLLTSSRLPAQQHCLVPSDELMLEVNKLRKLLLQ